MDKDEFIRVREMRAGLALPEVILAASFGIALILVSGILFVRQATAYADFRRTAEAQGSLRNALQAMTRQISNAGAWIGDPRKDFHADSAALQFAYFDFKAVHCPVPDTLKVRFSLARGPRSDTLKQEYWCGLSGKKERALATAPPGGLELGFAYFDSTGAETRTEGLMKSVRISVNRHTARTGSLPLKRRGQVLQVEMVNL